MLKFILVCILSCFTFTTEADTITCDPISLTTDAGTFYKVLPDSENCYKSNVPCYFGPGGFGPPPPQPWIYFVPKH
jgi:hypothetical protein